MTTKQIFVVIVIGIFFGLVGFVWGRLSHDCPNKETETEVVSEEEIEVVESKLEPNFVIYNDGEHYYVFGNKLNDVGWEKDKAEKIFFDQSVRDTLEASKKKHPNSIHLVQSVDGQYLSYQVQE